MKAVIETLVVIGWIGLSIYNLRQQRKILKLLKQLNGKQ